MSQCSHGGHGWNLKLRGGAVTLLDNTYTLVRTTVEIGDAAFCSGIALREHGPLRAGVQSPSTASRIWHAGTGLRPRRLAWICSFGNVPESAPIGRRAVATCARIIGLYHRHNHFEIGSSMFLSRHQHFVNWSTFPG